MDQHTAEAIPRPRRDYQPLHDVIFGLWGYPAVLVAHDLKVFPLLAEAPRTLSEICEALHLTARPARALLAVCTSLGLVQVHEECYTLTPLSEDYLLDSSPTYFGGMFDMMIANNPVWSFESVKKAMLTDTAQVYGGGREMFQSHVEQAELARAFTRIMHSRSIGPALAWPETLDLSGHRLFLDVGGGSGAHSIGATLRCRICMRSCSTWLRCVRWPTSISPSIACRSAFRPWWGICGRTRSRQRMFTSIR